MKLRIFDIVILFAILLVMAGIFINALIGA
jgi:hypothetical protein